MLSISFSAYVVVIKFIRTFYIGTFELKRMKERMANKMEYSLNPRENRLHELKIVKWKRKCCGEWTSVQRKPIATKNTKCMTDITRYYNLCTHSHPWPV